MCLNLYSRRLKLYFEALNAYFGANPDGLLPDRLGQREPCDEHDVRLDSTEVLRQRCLEILEAVTA